MKKLQHSYSFAIVGAVLMSGVIWLGSLSGCAALNALAGLAKLEFKIMDTKHVSLCGIDVTNKHAVSDFNFGDGLSLLNAFRTGQFPLTLTVDVAARNPNPASTGGIGNTLQLTQFPWTLSLDQHPTISGGIGAPVSVPGGGTTEIIPLQTSIDLKQFFANKSYDDMINLATTLSGQGGSSHVQLVAQPTIGTPVGSFKYPNPITIVNTEFRGNN